MLVVIPTTSTVIIDNSKVEVDRRKPPITITMESIKNINIPTLIPVLSQINCAIKSVPLCLSEIAALDQYQSLQVFLQEWHYKAHQFAQDCGQALKNR